MRKNNFKYSPLSGVNKLTLLSALSQSLSSSLTATPSINPENLFGQSVTILKIFVPLALGLVVVKVLYGNNSPRSSYKLYGVKKPTGNETEHERRARKEFFLPTFMLPTYLIEILAQKESTYDTINIFSDFRFYRRKLDLYIHESCQICFIVIYLSPIFRIFVFLTETFCVLTPQIAIIYLIPISFFAATLAYLPTNLSISCCSYGFEKILMFCSFLSKKIRLVFSSLDIVFLYLVVTIVEFFVKITNISKIVFFFLVLVFLRLWLKIKKIFFKFFK